MGQIQDIYICVEFLNFKTLERIDCVTFTRTCHRIVYTITVWISTPVFDAMMTASLRRRSGIKDGVIMI